MAVETPNYEVLRHDGQFELRRYEGYRTASVRVRAVGYGSATNTGFGLLADYIFGNNQGSDRIAMTAPVSAGRRDGQKIAMTVPVTAQQAEETYVVSFTMPSEYQMADLPLPNDDRVQLGEKGPHTVAAVRFGGTMNDRAAAQAQRELEEWMQERGLAAAGEPVVAQYDSPWKPWFARRNEILIPVAESPEGMH